MRLISAIFRLIDGKVRSPSNPLSLFTPTHTVLQVCRCIDLRYIDSDFPATASSVNSQHPEGKFYAWMRAFDLSIAKGNDATYLFADGITAGDLCQGGLGDCWLISAIAALAEYPGLIQRIFITKETSPFGRYTLRLFDITEDGGKGKFVNVTVDDRLPCKCDGGFPSLMYLSMDEAGEIWPLLIEKALAKWSGSYSNLDGGHCAWALATLTGYEVDTYINFGKDDNFTKCNLQPSKEEPRNPHKISFRTSSVKVPAQEMFSILVESDGADYVMTCGTGRGKDTVEDSENGIVQGHAYTLIGAYEVGEHRLVRLRNPWGR
jgi:calpain-15